MSSVGSSIGNSIECLICSNVGSSIENSIGSRTGYCVLSDTL